VIAPLFCYMGAMDTKPPIVHTNKRFSPERIEALRRSAQENGRSLHAEIVWALRQYMKAFEKRQGKKLV
jgi:hypothetical protein